MAEEPLADAMSRSIAAQEYGRRRAELEAVPPGRCGALLWEKLVGPTCSLRAGHAGWHENDDGASWTLGDNQVIVPRDALAALYAVWDTWWNKIGTLDPGDGEDMKGIASLLSIEDSHAMSEAAEAFAILEAPIRSALDLRESS